MNTQDPTGDNWHYCPISLLVIDDERHIRRLIQVNLIRSNEYEVIEAINGTEGIAKAISEHPDIIILDEAMPVMSGLQVLTQLRSDHRTRTLPVIFMFNQEPTDDAVFRGWQRGVDFYLTKPFNPMELIAFVRRTLEEPRQEIPIVPRVSCETQKTDWLEFEHEIRDLVEAFGYEAETTTPSHDFGVDVIAHSNHRTVVVQCKLYGKGKIGGDTMMKLVGSRQYFKVTDAICITTSKFTKQAQEIAANEDIKIVDRDLLVRLCRERNLTIPSLTVLATEYDALQLNATEIFIGRETNNHIVLSSPLVSRRHAVIRRENLTLKLSDCGSTNGIFLNGQRLSSSAILNYGDVVSICGTMFTVCLQTPTGDLCS